MSAAAICSKCACPTCLSIISTHQPEKNALDVIAQVLKEAASSSANSAWASTIGRSLQASGSTTAKLFVTLATVCMLLETTGKGGGRFVALRKDLRLPMQALASNSGVDIQAGRVCSHCFFMIASLAVCCNFNWEGIGFGFSRRSYTHVQVMTLVIVTVISKSGMRSTK